MGMVEQLLWLRHRREGDVGRQAQALELVAAVALEDPGHLGHQPQPRLDALVVARQPGIARKLGLLEELAEALPLAVARDTDEHLMAVVAVEDLVDRPRAHALGYGRWR